VNSRSGEIRAATSAVHGVLLVAVTGWLSYSLWLFWRNRHLTLIRARAPYWGTFGMVFSAFSIAIGQFLVAFTDYKIPCLPWAIFTFSIGVNIVFLSVASRLFGLLIWHEAELLKVKFGTRPKHRHTRTQFLLQFKHDFLTKNGFKIVASVLFILSNIGTLMILSRFPPEALKGDYFSAACYEMTFIEAINCIVIFALIVIGLLACNRRVVRARDNFMMKQEVKNLALVMFGVVVYFILERSIPLVNEWSIRSIGYNEIIMLELPAFLVIYFCLFKIFKASKSVEIQNVETAAASREELTASNLEELGVKEDINRIVVSDDAYQAFSNFLCAEFCVENLLFLKAVSTFTTSFEDMKQEERIERAQNIYQTYLHENALLMVNISGITRSQLESVMGSSELLKSHFETNTNAGSVFDLAVGDVVGMLSLDAFRRFKDTQEYKNTRPKTRKSTI
jgi:hypothetical protein